MLSRAAEGVDSDERAAPGPRRRDRGLPAQGRGRHAAASCCRALAPDRFEIVTGAADQGAGTVTMIARVAASALGVDESCIEVVQRLDGRGACSTRAPGASRVTRVLGEAARLAGEAMLRDVLAGDPGFPVEVAGEAEAPRGEHSDAFGAVARGGRRRRATGQITVCGRCWRPTPER